jgi:hypothetical protein
MIKETCKKLVVLMDNKPELSLGKEMLWLLKIKENNVKWYLMGEVGLMEI